MESPDLIKNCRTCESKSEDMYSIFDFNESTVKKYSEMIMECASVKIKTTDNLPKKICNKCVNDVCVAYNFKKQCEQTDLNFRKILKKTKIKQEQEDGFTCDSFEHKFENTEDSEILKETKHSNDNLPKTKKFKHLPRCEVCNKKYSCKKNLERHMRLHYPKKIYTCTLCKNKGFLRLDRLKRHMLFHLKVKPHKCNVCNSGFTTTYELSKHELKCKGQLPFVCEICSHGFLHEKNLIAHMQKHQEKIPVLDSVDDIDNYIKIEDINSSGEPFNLRMNLQNYLKNENLKEEVEDGHNLDLADYAVVKKEPQDPNEISEIDHFTDEFSKDFIPDLNMDDDLDDATFNDDEFDDNSGEVDDEEPAIFKNAYRNKISPKCKKCDKIFRRNYDLKRHLMAVHQKKMNKYPCNICGKTFSLRDYLVSHMRIHSKRIRCPLCRKEFINEENMLKHKVLKHGEECNNTEFDSIFQNFKEKIEENKKVSLTCQVCSKSFKKRYHLKRHILNVHHKKENQFVCRVCYKVFGLVQEYQEHLKEHTPEEIEKSKLCKQEKEETKIPVCNICKVKFETTDHLNAHTPTCASKYCKTCKIIFETPEKLSEHAYHCQRKYLCPECGERYTKQTYLEVHLRRHRGEKPFKCTYCEKCFVRTTDLKQHIKSHTGEKTHFCVECGKGFGRSYSLTLHMRIHTGEKPYKCTLCSSAFAQKYDCIRHIRRHTGQQQNEPISDEAMHMELNAMFFKRGIPKF